jgi:hypothetical protein
MKLLLVAFVALSIVMNLILLFSKDMGDSHYKNGKKRNHL